MGTKINCLVLKSIWSFLYSILMIYIATSHLRSQWVRGCITPFTFAITTMKFRLLLTWTVHEDFFTLRIDGTPRMHEPRFYSFPLRIMEEQGCMNHHEPIFSFLWSLGEWGHHHHQHWGSRSLLPQKALAWQPLAANEADGQLWRTRSSSAGLSTLLFCAPRLGHMQGLAGWV